MGNTGVILHLNNNSRNTNSASKYTELAGKAKLHFNIYSMNNEPNQQCNVQFLHLEITLFK